MSGNEVGKYDLHINSVTILFLAQNYLSKIESDQWGWQQMTF